MIPASADQPDRARTAEILPAPKSDRIVHGGASNGCIAQNYQFTTTVPNNNENLGLRLGQSLGKKDRLALNFQYQNRSGISPYIFGFLDNSRATATVLALNWTHTFAPRIFNIASVSFNRNREQLCPLFCQWNRCRGGAGDFRNQPESAGLWSTESGLHQLRCFKRWQCVVDKGPEHHGERGIQLDAGQADHPFWGAV